MHTQEQLERMSQQKKDTETELMVKEAELKKLKYQVILKQDIPDQSDMKVKQEANSNK